MAADRAQSSAGGKAARLMRACMIAAGVCSAASGLVASCSSSPLPVRFDGASLGYCSGQVVRPIAAHMCDGCSGAAYAICNGNTYSECACGIPNGYSLDGGALEGAQGPEKTNPVPFEGGVNLPCCTGKIVFELPASECPANCRGNVAYAICVNDAYTDCTCDIPAGYMLSNLTCDAGGN